MDFEPMQEVRAKGPQTCQPTATPWVRDEMTPKGRHNSRVAGLDYK